ncbi:MAG: hypothetical protein HQM14_19855 [SAR324 cluster bacterium]|nr:hypothetical protein [SAR324 cluster bacterium]
MNKDREKKALRDGLADWTIKWFEEGELQNEEQLLGIDFVSIIYNVFDDLCHSTHIPPNEIKKDHYFENVENYLKRSPILKELELLLANGYQLYFCSDHGSVLAEGNGAKLEKYLVDSYSKRGSTVEPSSLLDDSSYMVIDIPFIQDKKYLCAPKRSLFASEGTKAITHGGITLDELVIPFVKVNQ